jgi:hypothetical protein
MRRRDFIKHRVSATSFDLTRLFVGGRRVLPRTALSRKRREPRRSWRMNASGIRVDFNNMFTAMIKALLTSCWQRERAVEAD